MANPQVRLKKENASFMKKPKFKKTNTFCAWDEAVARIDKAGFQVEVRLKKEDKVQCVKPGTGQRATYLAAAKPGQLGVQHHEEDAKHGHQQRPPCQILLFAQQAFPPPKATQILARLRGDVEGAGLSLVLLDLHLLCVAGGGGALGARSWEAGAEDPLGSPPSLPLEQPAGSQDEGGKEGEREKEKEGKEGKGREGRKERKKEKKKGRKRKEGRREIKKRKERVEVKRKKKWKATGRDKREQPEENPRPEKALKPKRSRNPGANCLPSQPRRGAPEELAWASDWGTSSAGGASRGGAGAAQGRPGEV
ncbi:hypothetical protein E2320_000631 [Naja naja]|nr:hypothetical protein E2320_000631 [Naja naja]